MLRVLEDHQPLTLTGLGELLVCETGNNPSRLTARLVALGAVERRPGGKDRREVELRLTADGSKLARRVAEIEERMYKAIDHLLAGQDVEVILAILCGFVADRQLAKRWHRASPGRTHRPDRPRDTASRRTGARPAVAGGMEVVYTAEATTWGGREGRIASSDGVLDFESRIPAKTGLDLTPICNSRH